MGKRKSATKSGNKSSVKKTRCADSPPFELETGREKNSEQTIGGPKLNPLLIDVILKNLFHYILYASHPNEDIGERKRAMWKNVHNLRLVCKLWRDICTQMFLDIGHTVTFGSTCFVGTKVQKGSAFRLAKFNRLMNQSTLIPVQRFCLNTSIFGYPSKNILSAFMSMYAPSATELQFNFAGAETSNVHINIEKTFPDLNLEKLGSLAISCDSAKNDWKYSTSAQKKHPIILQSIIALLSSARNLKKFCFFRQTSYSNVSDEGSAEDEFRHGLCRKIPSSVEVLKLAKIRLCETTFKILTERGMQLKECSLESDHFNVLACQNFLEGQSETLKTLRLQGNNKSLVDFQLPPLKKLRYLQFTEGVLPRFNFFDGLPNLTVLNLTNLRYAPESAEVLSSGIQSFSVEKLHLPTHWEFRCDPGSMKMLGQNFPNVKKLYVGSAVDLPEIFLYFSGIEELSVTYTHGWTPEEAAAQLSGLPLETCKKLMEPDACFEDVTLSQEQFERSFLHLTKLKKLVLGIFASSLFTRFTAHFIFLKMASLEELYATVELDKMYVSPESIANLKEKIKIFEMRIINRQCPRGYVTA